MIYLYATCIATAHYLLRRLDFHGPSPLSIPVSPDGWRYINLGHGRKAPSPFHLRWLLPKVLGHYSGAWAVWSGMATIATAPALCWYLDGFTPTAKLVGVCLLVGLPGVFRINVLYPVLVDPTGMFVMVLEAAAIHHHRWWLAGACILLSGMVRETVPVFAAVAAWNPLPLLGLLPVAVRALRCHPAPADTPPGRVLGPTTHVGEWFDPVKMLLPWGVCLLGAAAPSWALGVALALAYGQLVLATDGPRLYQWAFPLAIVATLQVMPPCLYAPLVLAHWFNPFQKTV